jgi:hypothetical protein
MYQVDILDHNAFGQTLLSRAFTDRDVARTWGEEQVELIIAELRRAGDDLFDIEYTIKELVVDDISLSTGRRWRS